MRGGNWSLANQTKVVFVQIGHVLEMMSKSAKKRYYHSRSLSLAPSLAFLISANESNTHHHYSRGISSGFQPSFGSFCAALEGWIIYALNTRICDAIVRHSDAIEVESILDLPLEVTLAFDISIAQGLQCIKFWVIRSKNKCGLNNLAFWIHCRIHFRILDLRCLLVNFFCISFAHGTLNTQNVSKGSYLHQ